jgi:hypothetical protein
VAHLRTLSITDARKAMSLLAKHDEVLRRLIERADIGSHVMMSTPEGRVKRPGVKLNKEFFAKREAYARQVLEYVNERLATKGYQIADRDRPALAKGLLTGFFVEDMVAGMIRLPGASERFARKR